MSTLATFSVCTCDAAFVSTLLMLWLSRALYEKRVHLFLVFCQAQSDSATIACRFFIVQKLVFISLCLL